MTNDEKLMQQALEALLTCTWSKQTDAAIAALRERLAQSGREYADAMCKYHDARIKRLTAYLHTVTEAA